MLLRFQNSSRFDLSQRTLTAVDAKQLIGDGRDLTWNAAAARSKLKSKADLIRLNE